MTGLVTAMVALFGIILTTVSLIMTGRQNKAHRAAMKEDRDTAQAEKKAARDAVLSDRFARAIDHLKDVDLAIRMGALVELKKLGLEVPDDQKDIVRILGPFIREGIENLELLVDANLFGDIFKRPKEDIILACEIASLFFEGQEVSDKPEERNLWRIDLSYLKAEKLDLKGLQLQGARLDNAQMQDTDLDGANLQGAVLDEANLQEAFLTRANLRGANFVGADLRYAKSLTAAQLLEAIIDDTTLLDPDLRAEYNRLKAEQDANREA